MSVQETLKVIDAYLASDHAGGDHLASDVCFTIMADGQEAHGPEAVLGLLDGFYHGAFEAVAEQRSLVVGDGRAAAEFDLVGTHTGEFAGVAATGLPVRVPFAVMYDVADGLIQQARVYFEIPVFLAQVAPAS